MADVQCYYVLAVILMCGVRADSTKQQHQLQQQQQSEIVSRRPEIYACLLQCQLSDYSGYGSYCLDRRGSGQPADEIDQCCRDNQRCLSSTSFCSYRLPISYVYKCDEKHMVCSAESNGGAMSCANSYCKCKAELTWCLNKYPCPRRQDWVCQWFGIGCNYASLS